MRGQEIELVGSINNSSENRLQNAHGIGMIYSALISQKLRSDLGIHYYFNNSKFTEIPYNDADPQLQIIDNINSQSNRFSIRLNIQKYLIYNEYYALSLGPEISYNLLWGSDKINEYNFQDLIWINYSRDIGLARDIGIGITSGVVLKQILIENLSICLNIRFEHLWGRDYNVDGISPIFSGSLGFTEFQIGLGYKL